MSVSQKKLILISLKTHGRCFYCNRPGDVVDHFEPKSKAKNISEANHIENLVLACTPCNSSKSDQTPVKFIGGWFKAISRIMRANKRIGYGGGKTELEAILRIA